MSTSPDRLKHLKNSLANVSRKVKEIHLNLAYLYRNKEPYDFADIKDLVNTLPNVKVFWQDHDDGPIMKSLPAFRRLSQLTHSWIVCIDDDAFYDDHIFDDIAQLEPSTVYSGQIERISDISLVFGVAAIAFPTKLVTSNLIDDIVVLNSKCKFHDDLGISIALLHQKIVPQARPWRHKKEPELEFRPNALLWMNRPQIEDECLNLATSLGFSKPYNLNFFQKTLRDFHRAILLD